MKPTPHDHMNPEDIAEVCGVEEDGDEVFVSYKDVRCNVKPECGGSPLVIMQHDYLDAYYWRCPVCRYYYGEQVKSPPQQRSD